jgi:hypothetical protein
MTATRAYQDTEYIIYGYQNFEANRVGHNKWEVISIVPEQGEAIQTAERLYASNDYKKIEIKKKSFDERSKRYIASTFKILEQKSYKAIWLTGLLTILTLLPALALLVSNL